MVRRATAEEVIDLRHKVLRPGRPRETAIWACDALAGTRHWVLERNGRILACASVVDAPFPDGEGPGLQLRGMAVDPEFQGHGLGRELLTGIAAEMAEPLWCNARLTAEAFYLATGWRAVGPLFEIAEVGPHRRMIRALK